MRTLLGVLLVAAVWSGCTCRGPGLQMVMDPPDSGCRPKAESCNGLDDDCDGEVDEGVGPDVTCGRGACERKVTFCAAQGGLEGATACVPGQPTMEICNGLDDDCDGAVDEALFPTECGVGECAVVAATCMGGQGMACTPGAPKAEVCNGLDDDCDGSADEELVTNLSADIRVTNDAASSDFVYAGWNGQRFALAWSDKRDGASMKGEIYVATLDADGKRASPDRRMTSTTGASTHPALAWSGNGYGLVYADDTPGNAELFFQRLDAEGIAQGAAVRLTNAANASVWPDLVWNGTEFAVAWEDARAGVNNTDIYLQRLTATGQKIGGEVQITNHPSKQTSPILKSDGKGGYGLVFTDFRAPQREVHFVALNAAGEPVAAPTEVSRDTADSAWADLTLTDTEWVVVWHDARHGTTNSEVYLQRLDLSGAHAGDATRLSNANGFSGYPSVDWNGYELGVSWQDERGGTPAIYFAQVSAKGVKNSTEKKLSGGTGEASFTTALWNGKTFGFAWRDDRDGPTGNSEIYFAQVGCPKTP